MNSGAARCLKVVFLRLVLHVMCPVPFRMYITAVLTEIHVPDVFSLTLVC